MKLRAGFSCRSAKQRFAKNLHPTLLGITSIAPTRRSAAKRPMKSTSAYNLPIDDRASNLANAGLGARLVQHLKRSLPDNQAIALRSKWASTMEDDTFRLYR